MVRHPWRRYIEIPGLPVLNDQGLYIFDCVIVPFDNRFTKTDIAITFPRILFVRKPTSISRILMDMEDDSDGDDEDIKHSEKLCEATRKEFIEETRRSVRTNLKDANLPD